MVLCRITRRCWQAVARCCAVLALLASQAVSAGEPIDLELWLAWGGGAAERWHGEICIDPPVASGSASIQSFTPVGLSLDEPGAMYLEPQRLVLDPRLSRTYDAVRIRVVASSDATLTVRLQPDQESGDAQPVTVPLTQLVSDSHTSDLDDRGNRLVIRRWSGDALRVRFTRESLVFSPGERFEFFIDPHELTLEPDATLLYTAQLRRARTQEVVWEEVREARADSLGEGPEVGPFSLSMPTDDGAYDLWVSLGKRRLPTRFAPAKVIRERSVQVVVVSSDPPPESREDWQVLVEWPAEPESADSQVVSSPSKLFQLLPKLPSWNWIPGTSQPPPPPFGNGKSRKQTRVAREFVELQTGGWLGYVLPVSQPGRPHTVEIEYPRDVKQTLSISVLEPDPEGVVSPVGLNFGLDLPQAETPSPEVLRYRIVFWPRTDRPLLLLTNRREEESAWLGRVRVLHGPSRLPPAASPRGREGRVLGTYLDRPLLAPAFGGTEFRDPVTGRSLSDWQTFYQSGARLAQYVRHVGYNATMLAVTHDGGSLYPSRRLLPTPRYDNGVFFGTAQDPFQKDVLELLFRIYDREGLRLVPLIHFSAPLPELEALRRSSGATVLAGAGQGAEPKLLYEPGSGGTIGIDLVDAKGNAWRDSPEGTRGIGSLYNPVDPRVQQAMRRVVMEVVERYGRHPSFAGIGIQLGPDAFTQFPDALWGCDATTLKRFALEEGIVGSAAEPVDAAQLRARIQGELAERWLQWRAARLAASYRELGHAVRSQVPHARLYLAGNEMLSGADLQAALQPRLPEQLNIESVMLRVGFAPREYPDQGDILLLRPYRMAPLLSLKSQAANLQLRNASALDDLFGSQNPDDLGTGGPRRATTGSLLFHEPQSITLADFQETSPFGADKTTGWLLSQISPAGSHSRRALVHSLATLDSQVVFDGGWTVPMGHQESLAAIVEAFRNLPEGRFQSVPPPAQQAASQPIIVRRLVQGDRTFVYAVNDSPWALTMTLQFTAPANCPCEVFGSRQMMPPMPEGDGLSWTVTMDPYDLVLIAFEKPNVAVNRWNVDLDRDVLVDLRTQIDELRRRANQLKESKPLSVLGNPAFELADAGDRLAGWDFSRQAGVTVQMVPERGRNSTGGLHVQSTGPVAWVRSNTFPAPRTGRLSVWIWLRVDDPTRQPPLQLAIEGRLYGDVYYRPAKVGADDGRGGSPPPPLTDKWAPYLVRVDDLPTTGLTDLRVAVDLMGTGDVWIDDVQVFDLWFDRNEQNELLKTIALANYYLGKSDAIECHRILGGYWPEFLRRHVSVPPPELAAGPQRSAASAGDRGTEGVPEASDESTWLQRIVPKPRLPTWFR